MMYIAHQKAVLIHSSNNYIVIMTLGVTLLFLTVSKLETLLKQFLNGQHMLLCWVEQVSCMGFLLHMCLGQSCHFQVELLKNSTPILTKNYSGMFKKIKAFSHKEEMYF